MNMSGYGAQPGARQTPRLQNTNKTGLGNGGGGWGGFGMPSSGGAFGGLGAAPGLGQGRPGQLSGFAQVMGGGSGQGPIDMSDFPSLGQLPQQNNANATGWNSNVIRQPPTHQQQSQAPQPQQSLSSTAPTQQSSDQFDGQRSQQPAVDRAGGGDDFPPLSQQMNSDLLAQTSILNSTVGSPDNNQQSRVNGQQSQLPLRDSNISFQQSQGAPLTQTTSHTQPQTSQNGQPPPPASGVKRYADMAESEKWGLQGLLAAFEHRRQVDAGGMVDETLPAGLRSSVIMGHDLGSLGMDLDSPDPLYPTFTPFPSNGTSGSTFDYHDRHMVPDYPLPSAYTVTNVPPLSSRMSAFADETLFTIFYQMPRDVAQELASHELVSREWRWHKVLHQWLQKDTRESNTGSSLPLVDMTNSLPVGQPPIRTSERGEKGVYIFFDAMNWRRERRFTELDYEHLDPVRVSVVPNVAPPTMTAPSRLASDVGQAGSSQIPGA